MALLLVARRDGALVLTLDLARRRKVTVGRSGRCDLHLDAPSVSRRHALLARHEDSWLVIDTASSTGVHVPNVSADEAGQAGREERVHVAPLSEEGWVRIGPAFLWLEGVMDPEVPQGLPVVDPALEDDEVAPPALRAYDLLGRPIHVLPLAGRAAITIGRSSACDLAIDDPALSRLHAIAYLEGEQWCIADAGSSGGTRVEGGGTMRRRLRDHMLARIGDTLLRIDGCSMGSGGEGTEAALFDTGGDSGEASADARHVVRPHRP